MPDISLVGVRLTVEGSEQSVAKLAAVDAAAKASATSLRDMGGDSVNSGLSRLVVSVEQVGGGMDHAAGKTAGFHGVLKDLDGTLSSVSGSLMRFTAYGIAGAAAGFAGLSVAAATFGVRAASSFEQTRISFETMLGSVGKGDALFKSLQQFNLQTPFGLPDLTSSAQTLLQYGFTGDTVMPVLKTLANVASTAPGGMGAEDLQRQALALGQINASGVVRGQDINQLTQAGFPIIKLLQQVTGQSGQQLQAQLQGGGLTLPASDLMAAIAGGRGAVLSPYADAARKQSLTGAGQWSNFTDTLRSDMATASLPLLQSLTTMLPSLTTSLDKVMAVALPPLNAFFTSAADKLPGFVDRSVPKLQAFFDWLERNGPMIGGFFKDLASLIPDLARVGGDLLPVVDGLARGFHDLLTLPFGIGTGLVVGLLTGLLGYNALKGTIDVVKGMAGAIDLLVSAEARQKFMNGMPGGIGPGGKILAGVGGAAGLGFSGYEAAQHGASVSNVLGGAASGAVLGGTIGSVVPGVGTGIGLAAGALVGGAGTFLLGQTHHHVNVNVYDARDPQAVTKQIDEYYRQVELRQGVPATP